MTVRSAARNLLAFYAEKIPYHKGKWRVVEVLLGISGARKLDDGKTSTVSRGGLRWKLNTLCRMQRQLFYHGAFDTHCIRELTKHLGPDSVFFDVGSYFGYYSMVISRETGGRALVYAFEPVPANYELLVSNRDLNGFSNVHAVPLAVSDMNCELSFDFPPGSNGGVGHISSPDAEHSTHTVTSVTLDRFVEEHGIRRLDAVKIDVEGAEMRVLAGARDALKRFRPVLLVEFNPPCLQRNGTDGDKLLSQIRNFGYEIFRCNSRGLRKFEGLGRTESYTNIFCVPRSAA